MKLNYTEFTKCGDTYVSEASTLGFPPGFSPADITLKTEDGSQLHFHFLRYMRSEEQEVRGWVYIDNSQEMRVEILDD